MDIRHFYTDNGPETSLDPIILLHGNGGNSSSFFYVNDYFSKFRRVLAVDTRGHGRTPKGEGEFSLRRFADDLAFFTDERKIKKAVIVGYSDGGNIAMLFALKYPEKVSALVLNGANIFPEGLCKKDHKWIFRSYKKACRKVKRHPDDRAARDEADMLRLMTDEPKLTPADLGKINVPTLVLVGSRDVIRPEHSKLIADSIPGASLVTVEGGHGIVKTNSGDYIKAVEEFLDGCGK